MQDMYLNVALASANPDAASIKGAVALAVTGPCAASGHALPGTNRDCQRAGSTVQYTAT